jgi:signal transduction histidine kinase
MSQQLWQAAKLATMGELAASIAHELNNPLATVSLRVEVLLGQMPPDAPQRRALEVVEQEVERMGQLVANLLQFTRRGQQQISTLDVREEIERTLELIHYHLRHRQIAAVCQFAPDVPMVQADRQQLRQLFLNLFTNASDAMPQGGTLTLQVRTDPPSQQLEIAISDTGMGIAAEDLPRVMEPFFTTKSEGRGTGLGLPICRRIVQEHQGDLNIVSTVHQGTTVFITLPTQHGQNGPTFIEA